MGASQYLRSENVIDSVKAYLTPDVVRGASSLVGESESSTLHAMHSTVPGLLSGLLNFSSSSEGASSLGGMIRDGGFGSLLGNPASLFAGGGMTSSMMSTGQSLVGKIFGSRASSVSNAIASSSGVKPASAGTLMSLLAPLTLGVVGKMAVSQGGITNLLRAQSKEITEATPSEVSHILGFGGRPVTAPAPTALYEEKVVSGARNWLPLLLVGLVALGLLGYWLSRRAAPPRVVETARPVAETAAPAVVPTPTVSGNLDQYLASGVPDVPRTFIFDNLNFETASTQLTQGSGQTVANLAAILKAHPTAQIQLAGHTDNTGNPQTNQQLSLDRANAVKAMLVNDGISANRVATVGYGQDRPVASNDSEEGRARNRRTELTVTSK